MSFLNRAAAHQSHGMAALRLRMGNPLHDLGFLISAGKQADKVSLAPAIEKLAKLEGIKIYATEGTSMFLRSRGIENTMVYRISDGKEPNFYSLMVAGHIGMVINILTGDLDHDEGRDCTRIRRSASERLIHTVVDVNDAIATIDTLTALPEQQTQADESGCVWEEIASLIHSYGGIINNHTHPDKAYTLTRTESPLGEVAMRKKWGLMDEVKARYTHRDLIRRMSTLMDAMHQQGVHRCRGFVDADSIVERKAIDAALEVKEKFRGKVDFQIGVQPLKGVINPEELSYYQYAVERADFLGALPSKDGAQADEHLRIVLALARELGKDVDVHVDQANDPNETECAELAHATIKYGMQGRVTAVHAISLAAKPKHERVEIINLMARARMKVVICPSAALSMKQLDDFTGPMHNSIGPVLEFLEAGIPVSMGTDNVADMFMPMSRGNMEHELWMLAEATRCYHPDILAKIACNQYSYE